MVTPKVRAGSHDNIQGFSVTCEIGFVTFSDNGELSPYQAAMLLIAKHGADGLYKFPSEDGGEVTVEVMSRNAQGQRYGSEFDDA